MNTALVAAIRESGGYLEDEGWQQTAQLMSLAADEIERLNARVEELEARTRQQAVPGPAARAMQLANNWRASR
jgi:hypothetical protein